MRHALSLIIALLTTAIAMPLLFAGWSTFVMQLGRLGTLSMLDLLPGLALAAAGALLLAVATAAVALSSVGPIVTGVLHVLGSAALLLVPVPPTLGDHLTPLVFEVIRISGWIDQGISTGFMLFVTTGAGLVIGAIQLTAGLSVIGRRRRSPLLGVILGSILGVVLLLGGSALGAANGETNYRSLFMMFLWDVPATLLVMLAAALVVAGCIGLRWTSIGAIAAGVGAIAASLVALNPRLMLQVFGADAPISTGFLWLSTIGLSLVAAGVGAWVRGRRARPLTQQQDPQFAYPHQQPHQLSSGYAA